MYRFRVLSSFALLLGFACSVDAAAQTLTTMLTFADLPATITLCRDSAAIAAYGADEQWQVAIDVDGNSATGDPATNGADVILIVETLPQTTPCTAQVVTFDSSALVTGVLVWNSSTNTYDNAGPFTVSVDTAANTLTFSNDVSGALAGFSSHSRIVAAAVAGYSQSSVPTSAFDNTAVTQPDTPASDPSGDVMSCSSPCSAAAPYYPLIDIVGITSGTGLLVADVDHVKAQFALASLPANITLCRDPTQFASATSVDTEWYAGIDVDANPSTGYGGLDAVIFVYTTPQSPGCTTHTAAIAGALLGEIDTVDASGIPTYAGDATVSVDQASGIITALVPYDSAALKGLSPAASVVSAALSPYQQPNPPAQDASAVYGIDGEVADPLHDVANCSGSCSTSVYWYPQTDLVGASLARADRVFASGFQ